MRAAISNGKGGIEIVEKPIPTPGPHEHLIKVKAIGVNRADLLQSQGKYPPPPGTTEILGLEASGCLDNGQLVTALLKGGAYADYVVAPKGAILSFPDAVSANLSSTQLAAIPEAFLAAYHVLFQVGKLSNNQTVLINAAASGVGTSAIQMVKSLPNTTIIANAGSQEKLDLCTKLGAAHVINYKQQQIADSVKQITKGLGVDLVIDCVGARQFRENERSLKRDGRWVIYGLLSGAKSPDLSLAGILSKRLTICGTTLRSRSDEYRANLVEQFSHNFAESFGPGGNLRPIIDHTFAGLDSVPNALEYLRSNKTMGKVVVEL